MKRRKALLSEEELPYSRKLSRKKPFANFAVLWLFAKVFSAKFGGVASFGAAKASNPRKFSSSKFFRYTVLVRDNVRKASKRASETREQTNLHKQEQNRTHMISINTYHLACAEGSALQCCSLD